MRLLVVTNHYPPQFVGGYDLRCYQTVNALREAGYEVFVLTSWAGAHEEEPQVYRLLQSFHWTDPLRWREKVYAIRQRAGQFLRNYTTARMLLEQLHPQGVLQWNPSSIGLGGAVAAEELHIPVIYFVGDMSIANYWQLFLGKRLKRYRLPARWVGMILQRNMIQLGRQLNMRYAVFNSAFMYHAYAQQGIVPEVARVVYNGIRYPVWDLHRLPVPDRFGLLYVGRVVQEKGLHVAIAVLRHLHQQYGLVHTYLNIVGDGDHAYIQQLHQQVQQAGLGKHVNFLGKVPPENLTDIYLHHRVLLFPVLWDEPFGLVLPEAMAHGLPPIASRAGAVPEIVRDGQEGFLVERGDAKGMAEKAACLIQNDSLWEAMRYRGLLRVKECFTQQAYLDQVREFINQVVG